MKILHLKYKMHKLVNLVFYLIIFIFGFILGFSAEKINFNKLISQFLFIDNASAQEVICNQYKNYFILEDVLLDNTSGAPGTTSIDKENNSITISSSNVGRFQNYSISLSAGTYYFSLDSIAGAMDAIEVRELKTDNTISWLFALRPGVIQELVIEEEMTVQFRFYNAGVGANERYSTYVNIIVHNNVCADDNENTGGDNTGDDNENTGDNNDNTGGDNTGNDNTNEDVEIEIVNSGFYEFAQKIFGEVSEENKFIYDFITFGLVATCFTLFVLIVGYILKKFFGG